MREKVDEKHEGKIKEGERELNTIGVIGITSSHYLLYLLQREVPQGVWLCNFIHHVYQSSLSSSSALIHYDHTAVIRDLERTSDEF